MLGAAFEECGVRLERDADDSWTKEGLAGKSEKPVELDAKGKPVKVEEPEKTVKTEGDKFLDDLLNMSGELEKVASLPKEMKTWEVPEGLNLLRHDNSVRVYAPVNKILQETDDAWGVRPKFIPREVSGSNRQS